MKLYTVSEAIINQPYDGSNPTHKNGRNVIGPWNLC